MDVGISTRYGFKYVGYGGHVYCLNCCEDGIACGDIDWYSYCSSCVHLDAICCVDGWWYGYCVDGVS